MNEDDDQTRHKPEYFTSQPVEFISLTLSEVDALIQKFDKYIDSIEQNLIFVENAFIETSNKIVDIERKLFLQNLVCKLIGSYHSSLPEKCSTWQPLVSMHHFLHLIFKEVMNSTSSPLSLLYSKYSIRFEVDTEMKFIMTFTKPEVPPESQNQIKTGPQEPIGMGTYAIERKRDRERSKIMKHRYSFSTSSSEKTSLAKRYSEDPSQTVSLPANSKLLVAGLALNSSDPNFASAFFNSMSLNSDMNESQSPTPQSQKLKVLSGGSVNRKKRKSSVQAADDMFISELKPYIDGKKRIPKEALNYFKSYLIDYQISPTLRKWLWKERIGNDVRMNLVLFNNLLSRMRCETISERTQLLIADDLIRTCASISNRLQSNIVFCHLKLLASIFEVLFSVLTLKIYRPDIGYTQGMMSIFYLIYQVVDGDLYETFLLSCNLLLSKGSLFHSLYTFDADKVSKVAQ